MSPYLVAIDLSLCLCHLCKFQKVHTNILQLIIPGNYVTVPGGNCNSRLLLRCWARQCHRVGATGANMLLEMIIIVGIIIIDFIIVDIIIVDIIIIDIIIVDSIIVNSIIFMLFMVMVTRLPKYLERKFKITTTG